ncbi:MAG: TonB-dependent receptor [Prevotellaceae bacterium]|nr:TonB-dependent receptor [Prevotellaceae bacterium]
MNIKIVLLFLLLGVSTSIFAQTATKNYTLKGVVTEEESGYGVPYATISLKKDSVSQDFLKRAAADAGGKFEFDVALDSGSYLIHIEAVGMEAILNKIELADNRKIDAGKFAMKEASNELADVQVFATAPLVTQDIDKIGYNVEADPESKTNTVIEMLRKVPLVTVDQDDEIKVKGSSSFKIYLNGKPSNMITKNPKDVLKSMPASSIKKIEVITDPGAKYDAEGVTAILNIVTQSALQGYTGSVRLSASTKGQLGAGAYLQTKVGKFGVTANMNWGQYGSPSWNYSHTENYGQNMPYKYSDTHGESAYKGDYVYGNLETSYEFDSLNLVSASLGVNGGKNRSPNTFSQTYMRNELNETVSAYNSWTNNTNSYYGISGNIDYQRTFRKPEQLLTLSYLFDLSPNNTSNISIIKNDTLYPNLLNTREMDMKYVSLGKSDEHTFQIDYTEPFDSSKHVIEAGLKYILRINSSDNAYKLYNPWTDEYDIDSIRPHGNNDLKYYQHIFGAYASYTFKLNNFSIRAGGRLEGTNSDVRFPDNAQRNFQAGFVSLIPSLSLSYKINDANTLRLSYSNGISRPSIWYLNPYIDDSNPYSISYGNPDLKPERSHNVSLNYGLLKQKFNMNFSLSSGTVLNSIESITLMDENTGIITQTYDNIGINQRFGGNIYVNYNPARWLRLWLQSNASYVMFKNASYEYNSYSLNAWGGANVTMPWKLKFNTGGGGQTPWVGYKFKGNTWYYYYFSLSRSFLKGDKLTVSLQATNPFEKYRSFSGSRWEDNIYNTRYSSRQLTRDFRLSVSFRFGEMKAEIKKAERGISNDDLKAGGNSSGGTQGGGGQQH